MILLVTGITRPLMFGWLALALLNCIAQAAVNMPVLSPRDTLFLDRITVSITAPVTEVRYTIDGSEPTTNSLRYAGPVILTNSTLLKARAFAGAQASDVVAAAFTIADTNVLTFTLSLPLVVIQNAGGTLPTPSNAPAWLQIINAGTTPHATLTNAPEFAGLAELKPRGYTSRRYPKKSMTVELLDASGEETKASLLGMPADSDWILYAPYPDRTLMRDVLAYELSNALGHYASRTRFVEVFYNDSTNKLSRAHYVGVYVLEEKIKVAPHRVAIHKMSAKDNAEPEITGGYLFKKDHLEKAGVDLPSDGPPHARPPALLGRFPTEAGGFPAIASGFLPGVDPPIFSHAQSITTNSVVVTNFLASTNVIVPPPSVTIVRTNFIVSTNVANVTNAVVATNFLVSTNFPVTTNFTVHTQTNVVTNAVVAAQTVTGTNTLATTNQVDANTVVINTSVTLLTSSTYRTNFVVNTNSISITNTLLVTNAVVSTNAVMVTNVAIASVTSFTTNGLIVTNVFTINQPTPAPGSSRLVNSGEGFLTSQANAFFFVEPKASKITPAQREWLTNYLNRFEAALYGPEFRNATNGYAAFIDVDSFIDNHLFIEATKNIDGFRFSAFFTKDRGGKLKMEPIWDWNLSMGLVKGKQGYMAQHWYWPQLNDQQYSWYRRLFEDPDFGQRYVDRWAQWRTNVFATSNVWKRIDTLAATLQEPAARNFERWPILGDTIGPEYFVGKTYAEEITYLKTWVSNRLAWIDAQFVPPPVMSRAPDVPAAVVNFVAPTGQVYVTTDGSDPRQAGGTAATHAQVAQSVVVSNAVKAIARTRSANGWSSPVSARLTAP